MPPPPIVLTEQEFRRDARARRDVGRLLADAFTDPTDGQDRARLLRVAHWGDAPIMRVVQCDDVGSVTGHVALFAIDHDRPLPHRVIGIGDLVVRRDSRGHGLGSRLISKAVDLARGTQDADVIFARTTSMGHVFDDLGFRPTRSGALSHKPGWRAWSGAGRLPRYRRLDPDDV